MAFELGELLQGTSGNGVAQAASAPTPMAPSVAPTQGGDFQQRKQGWLGALKEMGQDPETAMMLVQFGNSLSNPRPGASTAGQISQAFSDAMAFRGRLQGLKDQQGLDRRKQDREDRRVGLEERRADQADRRLEFEQTSSKEQAGALAEYRRKSLEIDKLRAEAAMVTARRPRAGGGGGGQTAAMLKELAEQRHAAALKANYPGMTDEQARQEVARRAAEMSRDEWVQKLLKEEQDLHEKALAVRLPEEPPLTFDAASRRQELYEEYDASVKRRYGLDKQAAGNAWWKGLSEEQRNQAVERARSDPEAARYLESIGVGEF